VRASILLWSALSGVVMGIVADALLVGLVLLVSFVAPATVDRLMHARWAVAIAAIILTLVLIAGAVLGYLEGELKAA
jgi:hypothetical protein